MNLNPSLVELGARSTSVLVVLESKLSLNNTNSNAQNCNSEAYTPYNQT